MEGKGHTSGQGEEVEGTDVTVIFQNLTGDHDAEDDANSPGQQRGADVAVEQSVLERSINDDVLGWIHVGKSDGLFINVKICRKETCHLDKISSSLPQR